MNDREEESPHVLGIARDLLREEGADFSSLEKTFRAFQSLFRRISDHLRLRIGDGGFRSLLQLAHANAMKKRPVLGHFIVSSDSSVFLEETSPSAEGEDEAQLCDGLSHIVAEALELMRDLGQGQDWGLVELWPGLKALKQKGLNFDPGAGRVENSALDPAGDPEG